MEFEWDSFEKETKVEKKNVEKMFVCMMTIVLGLSSAGWAASMGTAFTYQGRLTDGGNPASGPYDLQFKLYDAASVGIQVGGTITLDNITVSDGLFTVQLDFGGSAFDGDARWLAISVRPGASTSTYTPLSPRQELTPTPYAIYAQNGGDLSLPFAGSVSSSSEALSITNTGSGRAGLFEIINSGNVREAMAAVTNGNGDAVKGYSTGLGRAGRFLIVNINNVSPALEATTNGFGPAGLFMINNANNNQAAVHAITSGDGYAGHFEGTVRVDGDVGIGAAASPGSKLYVAGQVKSVVGGHAFYMVPQGAIIMWSGPLSNIPDGWGLCDGTNGTPDLRDRFIQGWTAGADPGGTGGASSHSHAVNSHSHGIKMWAEYYWEASGSRQWESPVDVNVAAGLYGGNIGVDMLNAAKWTQKPLYGLDTYGSHLSAFRDRLGIKGNTDNTSPGTSSTNHLPPYYKLAFIMKL